MKERKSVMRVTPAERLVRSICATRRKELERDRSDVHNQNAYFRSPKVKPSHRAVVLAKSIKSANAIVAKAERELAAMDLELDSDGQLKRRYESFRDERREALNRIEESLRRLNQMRDQVLVSVLGKSAEESRETLQTLQRQIAELPSATDGNRS